MNHVKVGNFQTEQEVELLRQFLDGKTFMELRVVAAPHEGSWTVYVESDYGVGEEEFRVFVFDFIVGQMITNYRQPQVAGRAGCESDTYKGFTRRQLSTAFEAIRDPRDWRAPINCIVPRGKVKVCEAAIEFFTATEVLVQEHGHHDFRIRSIGYRNGPAGDH